MKVERKIHNPEFIPIVITISSREEAMTLWHCLNCAYNLTLRLYIEETNVKNGWDLNLCRHAMWNALNEVFTRKDF